MFKSRKAYEPEDPDVDELGVLVLVEDDVDVLSLVDDVPEAVGLVSPEALASPDDFLA